MTMVTVDATMTTAVAPTTVAVDTTIAGGGRNYLSATEPFDAEPH